MNNTLSKEIEKIIEDCKDVDYGEDSVTLMFYDAKAIEQLLQLMQQESRREAIEFAKFAMDKTLQDLNTDNSWYYEKEYGDYIDVTDDHLYELYLLHKQNKEQ